MAVDGQELEGLMEQAGLGDRTRKKLRAANGSDAPASSASSPSRTRGHGASSEDRSLIPSI